MDRIRVGIIGYGASAKIFHLPFILPNKDLQVYAFLQRAEAPKDKSSVDAGTHCTVDYPNAKHYRSAKDFFADREIDLVIICSNVDTHAEFAEQALLADKHVVVEKPFTVTSAEADKIIALASRLGRILTCYQNRRYDSDFRTLKKFVDEGAFGTITEFENHYDMHNPKWMEKWNTPDLIPGEGMMYGLGSHSIDQTLQLFGLPASVTALKRSLRMESKTDDTFTIILQYGGEQKNLVCTIKTAIISPISPAFQLKYFVRGTKGMFIKNGEDPQIEQLQNGMEVTDPAFGVEPSRYHAFMTTRKELDAKFAKPDESLISFDGKVSGQKGSYADYYRDIVAAIRVEGELVVEPQEARDVIRVIELAMKSAEKGATIPWN